MTIAKMKWRSMLLLAILISIGSKATAQNASYDIVQYQPPQGWKQEQGDKHLVYSRIDGGSWAQIAIYQSTASKGDIKKDMQREWETLVLSLRKVQNEEQTIPARADGWSVMTRSGVWQHNGTNVATLLTTYSNGQVCFSILCNATAKPYLNNYKALIASVHPNVPPSSAAPATTGATPKLAGLWVSIVNEISGYSNGIALTSGGYFRKEYRFNADGSYQYRVKNWSVTVKDILYATETGTYAVQGNQLVIHPAKGSGGWWAKAANGRTEGWGHYQKPYDYKLEKTAYTFEIKYLSGMEAYYLVLKTGRATERDGNGGTRQEFNYSRREGASPIDAPPGRE